jgi:hypothetical protein
VGVKMITDVNNVVALSGNMLFGVSSGSMVLLGLAILLVVGFLLVMGKAKVSTSILSGTCIIFIFSLVEPAFMFMFWIALVVSLLMLVNGLRKTFTSQ